jgi:hypothetical protein
VGLGLPELMWFLKSLGMRSTSVGCVTLGGRWFSIFVLKIGHGWVTGLLEAGAEQSV